MRRLLCWLGIDADDLPIREDVIARFKKLGIR
jgi:hypothetical protein